MARIKEFLADLDRRWKKLGGEPYALKIIGASALELQISGYDSGTRDSDVLELWDEPVVKQLEELAGAKTELYDRWHLHIQTVRPGIVILPQTPLYHQAPGLTLKNFTTEVLDVVDVAVSKLARFLPRDVDDLRRLTDRELLPHARFKVRFESALERLSLDARAEQARRYIKNFNQVERDMLLVPESTFEFDWLED